MSELAYKIANEEAKKRGWSNIEIRQVTFMKTAPNGFLLFVKEMVTQSNAFYVSYYMSNSKRNPPGIAMAMLSNAKSEVYTPTQLLQAFPNENQTANVHDGNVRLISGTDATETVTWKFLNVINLDGYIEEAPVSQEQLNVSQFSTPNKDDWDSDTQKLIDELTSDELLNTPLE